MNTNNKLVFYDLCSGLLVKTMKFECRDKLPISVQSHSLFTIENSGKGLTRST